MIIALVMAGGKGLRLKSDIEKPLYPLNDKPLMSYVLDNIKESELIEKTVVAVSPNAPNTKEFLINDLYFSSFDSSFYDSDKNDYYLDTLGKGFVEDGLALGSAIMARCMNSMGTQKNPLGGNQGEKCILKKRMQAQGTIPK